MPGKVSPPKELALLDVLEFFKEELAYGDHRPICEERMRVLRQRVFDALGRPSVTQLMRLRKKHKARERTT